MKFDYSYLKDFFEFNAEQLEKNIGFKAIKKHSYITGNSFTIKDIDDAVHNLSCNTAYGLIDLKENLEKIQSLWNILTLYESEWIDEITRYIELVFGSKVVEGIPILVFPVVGYDIGIGMDNIICFNLNSELFLTNHREVLTILIHETTHILYERIHGSFFRHFKFSTVVEMRRLLNYAIQYEGAGVYSAEAYREDNNLCGNEYPIQQDYLVLKKEGVFLNLCKEYIEISNALEQGLMSSEEFLNRCFGAQKLTHRLGYGVFSIMSREMNVIKLVQMSNNDFVQDVLHRVISRYINAGY